MPSNHFDQASRYLAKLEPAPFLAWLTGLAPSEFHFRGWLDTRLIPFPGEPDRVCDTVAHLENVGEGHLPWAVLLEFQSEPDAVMFGRDLGYLAQVWLERKPTNERGDRFQLGAIVVNLTGRGNAARAMNWDRAGMTLVFRPCEINLCELKADETLDGIAAGTVPNVVLALIPLLRGGNNPAIIQLWLALASAEPNDRRRSELGALASIFATATESVELWKKALKGWNMKQSPIVLEWQAEARAEGKVEGKAEGHATALVRLMQLRRWDAPAELLAAINGATDLATLERWFDAAVTSPSLDAFRQATGL